LNWIISAIKSADSPDFSRKTTPHPFLLKKFLAKQFQLLERSSLVPQPPQSNMKIPFISLSQLSAIALSAACFPSTAEALIWDVNGVTPVSGGTGAWDNSSNFWFDGATYQAWPGGGDLAEFNATSNATIATATTINASGLTSSANANVLSGGAGAALNLTGSPVIAVNGNVTLSIAASLQSTGFTKTGSGFLTLSGANANLSGSITNSGGVIQVNSAASLGTVSTGAVASGAQFRQNTGVSSNIDFTIAGTGVASNPGLFGALRGDGANVVFDGDITLAGNSRISQATFNGQITGNFALEIGAAGGNGLQNTTVTTLTNAANNYGGDTTILASNNVGVNQYSTTLSVGAANGAIANGVGKGNLIIQGGLTTGALANVGTLNLNGNNETVNGLSLSGIAANARISNSVVATTSTLTVGDADANGDFGGVILNGTGTVAFTKIGGGTQRLSGTNTYTGATTVSAGTLVIDGNQSSATGGVTVATGATLAGIGIVGGATTISGDLAAGSSAVGLLSFSNGLTLNGTAESLFQINGLTRGTEFDAINITGALAYSGVLTLDFGFAAEASQTFNLFDFTSQSGNFTSLNFVDAGYGGTFDAASGVLTLTSVPEPGTTALLVGAGLALLASRRRRSLVNG
jgi:autotransporter-associated beta strand protein